MIIKIVIFFLEKFILKWIKEKNWKVSQPHENLYKKKRILNIRKEISLICYIIYYSAKFFILYLKNETFLKNILLKRKMKKIEIKEENILIILFSFYNIMLLFKKEKQEIIYNIQNYAKSWNIICSIFVKFSQKFRQKMLLIWDNSLSSSL